MRIPDLPVAGWSPASLALIASRAGRLVKLDESTSSLSKLRFARVAVEVNIAEPLVPGTLLELEGVDMPAFWQRFEYEHIHLFCHICGRIGHPHFECKYPLSAAPIVPPVAPAVGSSSDGQVPSSMVCDVVPNPSSVCSLVPPARADDERPVPCAWIIQRRRGFRGKQPPASVSTTTPPRESARDSQPPPKGRVLPAAWTAAPTPPAPRGQRSVPRAAPLRTHVGSVPSIAAPPTLGNPIFISDGSFGPLGLLDSPATVGGLGLQSVNAPGLMGSAPVDGSSPSGARSAGSCGVIGTGHTEAQLPPPSLSSSSQRKGKAHSAKAATVKPKRSRKSRKNIVLRTSASETDAEDQREDDVIMRLIESGCNLDDIDRLYCVEGWSAGDVERHCSLSATPKL